jgi:HAD superfamily hydrolase (TIGR01484 family)
MIEEYMQTRINAILSDYDGTLSPTNSIGSKADSIPKQLEGILCDISQRIPLCIVSSKDFHFISRRAKFARILSCIMGIETIVIGTYKNASNEIEERSTNSDIKERYLLPHTQKILQTSSVILSELAEIIESKFEDDVRVERKYTSDRGLLAGITIDYSHLRNWKLYKNKLEPSLKEIIQKYRSLSTRSISDLYVLTYRSHPFLDVYSLYSDKGMAFDFISANVLDAKNNKGILYLGDSENDNPAFRKASVSIGIISDKRLAPKLDCQYMLEFKNLVSFLKNLLKAKFVFSEDLLVK